MGTCCIKGRTHNIIGPTKIMGPSIRRGGLVINLPQILNRNTNNKMSSSDDSNPISMSATPSPLNLSTLDSPYFSENCDEHNVRKVRFCDDKESSLEPEPFTDQMRGLLEKRASLKARSSAPFLTVPNPNVHSSPSRLTKLAKSSSSTSMGSRKEPPSTLCVCSILQSHEFESDYYPNATSPATKDLPPLTPVLSTVAHTMLADREDEFISKEEITIFCTTWNCYGKIIKEDNIECKKWLECGDTPPDVYAIGLQEIDTGYEVLILNESNNEQAWKAVTLTILNKLCAYKLIMSRRLSSMFLMVYIKESLYPYVSQISSDVISTGIGGILANKGAVGIRFKLKSSTICMVNTHFSAHMSETEKRNSEYKDTSSDLSFKVDSQSLTLSRHNMIFWMGDLNYRYETTPDFTYDNVIQMCKDKDFVGLKDRDQFSRAHRLKEIFAEFQEGDIEFYPTYKYDPGTNNWDSSSKKRCPAWCDRILWRGEEITQIFYKSHPEVVDSDHKPVSAFFRAQIRSVIEHKFDQVEEEVLNEIQTRHDLSTIVPQVKLDKEILRFEELTFNEQFVQRITVKNVSQVPVKMFFVPKNGCKSIAPPYIKIVPDCYILLAGCSVEIAFTVQVGMETLPQLAQGDFLIEDMLVLKINGGVDQYIYILGQYQPSGFGASLEELSKFEKTRCRLSAIIQLNNKVGLENSEMISLGLVKIVEYLYVNGLYTKGLFVTQGLKSEMRRIRDSIASDENFGTLTSIHSAADCLITFLMSLEEPIIPTNFHQACIDANSNWESAQKVIEELPQIYSQNFRYIIAYLKAVVANSKVNKLNAQFLSCVFSLVLMREKIEYMDNGKLNKDNLRGGTASHNAKRIFLKQFLVKDYDTNNKYFTHLQKAVK